MRGRVEALCPWNGGSGCLSIFGVEVDASASVADAVFFSGGVRQGLRRVVFLLDVYIFIAQLGPRFVARGGTQIIYLATLHAPQLSFDIDSHHTLPPSFV